MQVNARTAITVCHYLYAFLSKPLMLVSVGTEQNKKECDQLPGVHVNQSLPDVTAGAASQYWRLHPVFVECGIFLKQTAGTQTPSSDHELLADGTAYSAH